MCRTEDEVPRGWLPWLRGTDLAMTMIVFLVVLLVVLLDYWISFGWWFDGFCCPVFRVG